MPIDPSLIKKEIEKTGFFYCERPPEDFDYLEYMSCFGNLLPQYDGQLAGTIKASDEYSGLYHSLNNKELYPHTECYEFDGLPPRYLALWCKDPANSEEGKTFLYDMEQFFSTFGEDLKRQYSELRLEYVSTDGLNSQGLGMEPIKQPFVEKYEGRNIFRYSEKCMDVKSSELVRKFVVEFNEFITKSQIAITWKKNALLIWDNHRMSHARSAFSSSERELVRTWIV